MRFHLLIVRYHAADWNPCMLVNMVEDRFKHLTTNIVEVNIDAIGEVPINSSYNQILQCKLNFRKRRVPACK